MAIESVDRDLLVIDRDPRQVVGVCRSQPGAAYAVHPAFAEARIVEFGSGLRPAYPDNLPRITVAQNRIAVNGFYRHGFLLAPALAELTLGFVQRGAIDNEVMRCA